MLKLLQSIFGGEEERGNYPQALIDAAIERAVDGTDPRLRAISGYKKKLRPSIIHAIDHVVALVDRISAPLPVGRADFNSDPRLTALFASADHMLEVFSSDAALNQYRNDHASSADCAIALLVAERVERNVLGMDMEGDMLRREVAQVAVNFRNQRLVEPTTNEADTRRQLKRRAFDHLLTLALTRITEAQSERADLAHQRDLLRQKLKVLERGGWSFEVAEGAESDATALNAELQAIETELTELAADSGSLEARLDIVAGLLGQAEQQLWSEDIVMCLDRMNIKREAQNVSAQRIELQELHNVRGRCLAILLVSFPLCDLPPREDMFTAAKRYLL